MKTAGPRCAICWVTEWSAVNHVLIYEIYALSCHFLVVGTALIVSTVKDPELVLLGLWGAIRSREGKMLASWHLSKV